ncbi:MAG: ABC transporter substrate-binding protein, partial [Campylobacter sp.]|nr:ABC transporter substrate-binding protein [Campylobacter sp.]
TNLQIWNSPDQLRAGVANGSFKVMMAPSNVGLNLANQGAKVGQINILTQGLNNILTKNQPINELGDLYGKKLIMPFRNDMPDIMFRVLFEKLNLDISRIQIDYAATPPEALAMFLSKDYDAAFLPEPMASGAILKGKTVGVSVVRNFDILNVWKSVFNQKQALIPQAGIIADTEFFASHKDDFALLHEDLLNALSWLKSNPQSAANIGTNYLPAAVPAIAQSIPHSNLCVLKSSEIKDEMMSFFEILMKHNPKLIGGKLPSDEFFLW